jgi:phosphate transport system ATP-binding protein
LARNKADLDEIVEESLRKTALWTEARIVLTRGTVVWWAAACVSRVACTAPEMVMDEPCGCRGPVRPQVEELIDWSTCQFGVTDKILPIPKTRTSYIPAVG